MIILVVSDRLHLTFICFLQPSSVMQLVVLFLLEVTLFFLLCKRKLFLATISSFSPRRILTIIVYTQ